MPTHDSGQSRPQRQHDRGRRDRGQHADASSDVAERHEKLTEDVDAILDEIDDVLETNAEEFVRSSCRRAGSDS